MKNLNDTNILKMSDLMSRNIGEKVIEDDMRAWRFWMAFLGFGYMHDSQAGAAGILLPNVAVFLRDIIESLKMKKKTEKTFCLQENRIQFYFLESIFEQYFLM